MTLAERLNALLAGVRVTSATSFSWYGAPVELAVTSHGVAERAIARGMLVDQLARDIYARFYLTGGRRVVPLPPPARPWLAGLWRDLRRANGGVALPEPGWRVLADDNGCLVVERDGLRIWARPEEVDDSGDGTVRLRTPVDLPTALPGFHCVRGETPPHEDGGPVDRFYWNLRLEAAPPLVRMATEGLNGAGIPFDLKVIADPAALGRADAGVLLVPRRDRAAALLAVRSLYSRLAAHLDPPTPAFTKPLAPGLGFAQDPGAGTSFGVSRSLIVAGALVAAYERGEHSADGRFIALHRAFDEARLDLDRPYLGPDAAADADLDLPGLGPAPAAPRRPRPEFLEIAGRIGRRLCDDAHWSRDRCTWLGPRQNDQPGVHLEVPLAEVGPALYEGTSGIALFLAELARRTDDERARRAAIGAVKQALASCVDAPAAQHGSLFGGWTGIAVATAYIGRLLDVPEFVERSLVLIEEVDDPGDVDVAHGRAGSALGLLMLADVTGEGSPLQRARRVAGSLVNGAAMSAGPEPVGVLHGIAGVVLALDAVAIATGESALRRHAARLRMTLAASSEATGISWCHGLAGIVRVLGDGAPEALGRLCDDVREHIDSRHPDLSLCHGLFGAADALVELGGRSRQPTGPLFKLAEEVGEAAWWDARDRGRWACGMLGEPPGLMLGLAGIGLGYLRLHDPQVFSPLAFGSNREPARKWSAPLIKEPV